MIGIVSAVRILKGILIDHLELNFSCIFLISNVGVLEANFVEPAHDKQGFERTIVLSRLEARLQQMQKTYWFVLLISVQTINIVWSI